MKAKSEPRKFEPAAAVPGAIRAAPAPAAVALPSSKKKAGGRPVLESMSIPSKAARNIALFPQLALAMGEWGLDQTKHNLKKVKRLTRELVLDHGAFGGNNESSYSIGERKGHVNVVAEALKEAFTPEERLGLFIEAIAKTDSAVDRSGQKFRVLELLGGREDGVHEIATGESDLRQRYQGVAFDCVRDLCSNRRMFVPLLPNTPFVHAIIASPEARRLMFAQTYARSLVATHPKGDFRFLTNPRITNLVRAGFVDRRGRPDLVKANDFLCSLFLESLPAAHLWA